MIQQKWSKVWLVRAAWIVALATVTQGAVAQSPSNPSVATAAAAAVAELNAPVDSAAVARAAAIADTGRMSPGYRDLSRYDTPGYCLAAIRGMEQETWRREERNLVSRGSAQDTLPAKAISVGRRCATSLPSVAKTAPIQLANLLTVAILLDDTVTVRAVVARQLALATTAQARGYVLSDAIDELLANGSLVGHPIRLNAATTLLAWLDSLGRDARVPRFLAHGQMRRIAESQRFDTTALLREDKALRTVIATFTPDEISEYRNPISMVTLDSTIVAWYRREPNLPAVVRGMLEREIAARSHNAYPPVAAAAMLDWVQLLASQVGKPAPPITGQFHFPNAGPDSLPEAGKVTLVMRTQKDAGLMSARMAMLRRLYDQYHAKGLEIVLVLKTEGFSWSSPPQSPADEAKTIAWYYYDFLKLPFHVVVDQTPFTTRPDGRRVAGRIGFERQYVVPQVIIGRDGRIFTVWLGLESESQMRAFIEQALAEPAAA